ncbi:MAG: hypothetical protein C0622_05655 [Desulfuromonas sp.]|nr:MAG: hypothetical protein C0622_05655 [Desulfuromonas sp.]
MKKYSSDKDINKEIIMLMRSGWSYLDRKKHGIIMSPHGRKLSVPGSPSDRRALYNFRRDVRQITRGGE